MAHSCCRGTNIRVGLDAIIGLVPVVGDLIGNVQVGEDSVRLEVTLPWLLHKFAEAVQKTIAGRGQILLEKK
jgi:hypothetical protein